MALTRTQEQGYVIKGQSKVAVTDVETSIALDWKTCYLHNTGANVVYMDSATGVNGDKWQIGVGDVVGPFTGNSLYLVCTTAATSTIKALFVEV